MKLNEVKMDPSCFSAAFYCLQCKKIEINKIKDAMCCIFQTEKKDLCCATDSFSLPMLGQDYIGTSSCPSDI